MRRTGCKGVRDNNYLSLYQYDANGERTYKLTGQGYTQIINGVPTRLYALTNATLYASPYLVATPKGYTKHYYAESERIASRIGSGGLVVISTPIVGQIDCSNKLQANSAYFDTMAQNRLSAPNYTSTHLLDTLYHWQTAQNNNEPDCYWYHPDHLGSASWVTGSNGDVVQYLYYLPWGEDYLNQRRSGYEGSRYTFSAKEKDTETGYSYFGSRYYSSDLSIWLSVDPMSDKYPSLSPYTYCANNPIKLVDPNGESGVPFINSKKKTITIVSKLYFYGSGATPELSRKIATGIASQWNGTNATTTIEGVKYKVRFRIYYETVSENRAKELARTNTDPKNNFIRVSNKGGDKSSFSLTKEGGNSFWFNTNDDLGNTTTPAHEYGHGLGLSHPVEDLSEETKRPDIMVPRNTPYGKNWSITNSNGDRVVNPNSRRVTEENVEEALSKGGGNIHNIIINDDGSY